MMKSSTLPMDVLLAKFGDTVKENISLAPYTSARIGGPTDYLVTAHSSGELAEIMQILWQAQLPYFILGGGSNVLVSDQGVRGVTVLNRAKAVRFESGDDPKVWVESGVVFSNLANRCAARGLSGLEWAATVPGTIGGAVYGNAGAFAGDMAGSLIWAEVLTESSREHWPVERMEYSYRASVLKRAPGKAVVLAAQLSLKNATKEEVSVKIGQFSERRKSTQPPGASLGSMFKNPEGDYAGRLIEAAGLKGTRIGNAEISTVHGNFFVNHGRTKAADIRALIELAQRTVQGKFGVMLDLEIELVGEW
ncbi:MAG TPA: UDP-N-acetylmuramate dehydrogenase [Anaerolineales bacterium]|nr:UDP-N-acetylmuramate dehydrogenase [Anaerolineales bacterium]